MKILICGLPGSGKTTLATKLAKEIGAIWFNGDEVRRTISRDLGFTERDREVQAYRMSAMCDMVKRSGHQVIADFICPTVSTRSIFNADFVIWMDTIKEGRFVDTNQLFQPLKPTEYNLRITDFSYKIDEIIGRIVRC